MWTFEIKLQLNNAAGGRLKRNKILFYFRRPHIPEIKLQQNIEITWNSFSLYFLLFQFYFTMCDGLYV